VTDPSVDSASGDPARHPGGQRSRASLAPSDMLSQRSRPLVIPQSCDADPGS
jgi:hypothetical protein